MKKTVLSIIAATALGSALLANTLAAPDDTITTTVTPITIAIDILEAGPLAYGNVPLGTQNAVPTPTSFTVQNDGTNNVDLQIAGFNTSGGWNLVSSQGADAYVHYYSLSGAANSWSPMSTTAETFKANLPATGTDQQSVFLKLDMPTSTGNFNQQTMPVKVTATSSN